MLHPILITGAAGRVGGIGRTLVELLLGQGKTVRALVRHDDQRAQHLRELGAEVVVGNLLDLDALHRAIDGCEAMYFGMSVSEDYLSATVNVAAVARHHGVQALANMSQMTVAQMNIHDSTPSPQHKLHWLAEQALNWSGLPVVHVRPTVLIEGFFQVFTQDSVRDSNQILLPFGEGKTSPVAVDDVANVVAVVLSNPRPHIGKIYHLTGPNSENMDFYASSIRRPSAAPLPITTYLSRPGGTGYWRGLPLHLVNHLTTMADMHRAGRYDRLSDDVRLLTGQNPLSVEQFVWSHAAAFTAKAQAA